MASRSATCVPKLFGGNAANVMQPANGAWRNFPIRCEFSPDNRARVPRIVGKILARVWRDVWYDADHIRLRCTPRRHRRVAGMGRNQGCTRDVAASRRSAGEVSGDRDYRRRSFQQDARSDDGDARRRPRGAARSLLAMGGAGPVRSAVRPAGTSHGRSAHERHGPLVDGTQLCVVRQTRRRRLIGGAPHHSALPRRGDDRMATDRRRNVARHAANVAACLLGLSHRRNVPPTASRARHRSVVEIEPSRTSERNSHPKLHLPRRRHRRADPPE